MLVPPRLFCETDRLNFFKNGVGYAVFLPIFWAHYLLTGKRMREKWGRGYGLS